LKSYYYKSSISSKVKIKQSSASLLYFVKSFCLILNVGETKICVILIVGETKICVILIVGETKICVILIVGETRICVILIVGETRICVIIRKKTLAVVIRCLCVYVNKVQTISGVVRATNHISV
jgi:hypothetical protein